MFGQILFVSLPPATKKCFCLLQLCTSFDAVILQGHLCQILILIDLCWYKLYGCPSLKNYLTSFDAPLFRIVHGSCCRKSALSKLQLFSDCFYFFVQQVNQPIKHKHRNSSWKRINWVDRFTEETLNKENFIKTRDRQRYWIIFLFAGVTNGFIILWIFRKSVGPGP